MEQKAKNYLNAMESAIGDKLIKNGEVQVVFGITRA